MADLLTQDDIELLIVRELSNMAWSSENAIFSFYWWLYEMQPCRNQDFFKNASSAHKKRMKEFRELARQMVEERNDQILTEN